MSCKVYLACKITGLKAKDITAKCDEAVRIFKKYGLDPISPWAKEQDMYDPEAIVDADAVDLYQMWRQDKEEVLSCHVLCDIDGHLFSRGSSVESGFMRYGVMSPVVFVDSVATSIRTFESDYVAPDLHRAAQMIRESWGTWGKRVKWRLRVVWSPRTVLKRIIREIRAWG